MGSNKRYTNICVDIECLSTESTAIILSVATVKFDLEEDRKTTFPEFMNRAKFFKFDAKAQVPLKRTASKKTVDWWSHQSPEAQAKSLIPSPLDLSPLDGFEALRKEFYPKGIVVWCRGSLDGVVLSSFANALNEKPLFFYYNQRDVRTALNCFGIPSFTEDKPDGFVAHDPVSDICADVMRLCSAGD
jgi:hypothetical protein